MEQLYSYEFWKGLLKDLKKSTTTYYLCSISSEFHDIWTNPDLKILVVSFAKDFLLESDYKDTRVMTANDVGWYLFYTQHTKFKGKKVRMDFCKYMMLRTAYSEKDGVGDF